MNQPPTLFRPLRRLTRLSWAELLLLLETVVWLILSGSAVRLLPFRHIARHLGVLNQESARAIEPEYRRRALEVGRMLRAAARRTPWWSTCLVQAVAGQQMLRRRSIPSTLYLGVAPGDKDRLRAHAWLRCGSDILTGASGREEYTTVSCFGFHHDGHEGHRKL